MIILHVDDGLIFCTQALLSDEDSESEALLSKPGQFVSENQLCSMGLTYHVKKAERFL